MLWVFVDLLTFVVAFDHKHFWSLSLKDMMLPHSPLCPSNQFLNHQMVQSSNLCSSSLEDLLHEVAGHLCWDSLLLSLEVENHVYWTSFLDPIHSRTLSHSILPSRSLKSLKSALLMPSYRSYHTPLVPVRSWPCMHAGVSSSSCFVPMLSVFA